MAAPLALCFETIERTTFTPAEQECQYETAPSTTSCDYCSGLVDNNRFPSHHTSRLPFARARFAPEAETVDRQISEHERIPPCQREFSGRPRA